jgi:hypothetical protein
VDHPLGPGRIKSRSQGAEVPETECVDDIHEITARHLQQAELATASPGLELRIDVEARRTF